MELALQLLGESKFTTSFAAEFVSKRQELADKQTEDSWQVSSFLECVWAPLDPRRCRPSRNPSQRRRQQSTTPRAQRAPSPSPKRRWLLLMPSLDEKYMFALVWILLLLESYIAMYIIRMWRPVDTLHRCGMDWRLIAVVTSRIIRYHDFHVNLYFIELNRILTLFIRSFDFMTWVFIGSGSVRFRRFSPSGVWLSLPGCNLGIRCTLCSIF